MSMPFVPDVKLSSVSFFCPAYYDRDNLPILIPKAHQFLHSITDTFEIIIVEDGSPDDTGKVADRLAKEFSHVRVIHHPTNRGYGAALKTGFLNARYDYILYTDGDNQYDISELKPHLGFFRGFDVLNGYAIKKAVTGRRKAQSAIFNALIDIFFLQKFRDVNCSLKMYKRCVIDRMVISSNSAFIDAEMLIKAKRLGFRIYHMPVTQYRRLHGLASGAKMNVVLGTIKDLVRFRFGLL